MTRTNCPALRQAMLVLAASCLTGVIGCKQAERSAQQPAETTARQATIELRSEAFSEGRPIPARHTGDGEDLSPPLSWSGLPEGARELALIADDPDAPSGDWVHWVVYKIPVNVKALKEGVPRSQELSELAGALQGRNSRGTTGYHGPAPPPGKPHRYFFKLYALDAGLDLKPGLTKEELLGAISGHILAQGQLMGTYQR